MTSKRNMPGQRPMADEPAQVFRQFAWNLAGSLAQSGKAGTAAAKPYPAKPYPAKPSPAKSYPAKPVARR